MSELVQFSSVGLPLEVPPTPPAEGPVIHDDQIREILGQLGVVLHGQIADANTFFGRGSGHDHRLAFPMDDAELAAWQSVHDIDTVVEDAVAKKKLYVVNIDRGPEALTEASAEESEPGAGLEHLQMHTAYQDSHDHVRVNYGGQAHWVSRERVTLVDNTDGLTHLIKPEIYFGGHGHAPGHLYNAFVSVDAFAAASNGTQLVSDVHGRGFSGSHRPVFNPHRTISTSVWMNTSITEGAPIGLSVTIDKPEQLMISAALHDLDALPDLEVPESVRLRTWFWQLDHLMRNQTLALTDSSLPEIEAK